jgi:hypothetical protein
MATQGRHATEKMADYRARQRARGLRPVELWVHDTADPAFQERLRREAEAIRDHPSSREGLAFTEAAAAELWAEADAAEGKEGQEEPCR